MVDRVVVIGTSCSGKTTFARRLAEIIDCPWTELDRLHWLPDWEPRPLDDFRRLVAEKVSQDRWVIDGNYSSKVRTSSGPRRHILFGSITPFRLFFLVRCGVR